MRLGALVVGFSTMTLASSAILPAAPHVPGVELRPLSFVDLQGFSEDDTRAAWETFARRCKAISEGRAELRRGSPIPPALAEICAANAGLSVRDANEARAFFMAHFNPYEIVPVTSALSDGPAFFTGYYEPVVAGALQSGPAAHEPLRARPPDLVTLNPGDEHGDLPPDLSAARRMPDGKLLPYPDRAEIEAGVLGDAAPPVVFVRDAVEAFLIHVQGSAAIRLADGHLLRFTYAGRNGLPYTSIGRILIDSGEIPEAEMTLARLKQWVRAHGQNPGEAGRALLQRNRSYVFFSRDDSDSRAAGPIGAASVPLTALRSIAVDRGLWAYGLPFWIEAALPWRSMKPEPFHRLMIAQDTGSAIIGPARADLFFGTGDDAGERAGDIRHRGRMIVLWPRSAGTMSP